MKYMICGICLWVAGVAFALPISEEGRQEAQLFNTFLQAVYIHQDDMPQAFDALEKALALSPDSKYVRRLLVSAAVAMDAPDKAAPYVTYIDMGENDADDWSVYGAYLLQKKDTSAALAAYEKAWEKRPDDTDLLYRYLTLLAVTDIDKALAVLEKFAQENPAVAAQAYTQIGRLYAHGKQFKRALAYLDKAVQADDKDPAPRLAKAEIYEVTSQFFLMLHEFEELEKMGYGNAGTFSRMAAVFVVVKDLPKAKMYFEKAKAADNTDTVSNYFLSLLAEEQGDLAGAITYLQAAADYPENASRWLQVGFLQQKLNQPQESLKTLAQAYKKFEGNVEIGFFYGLALNDNKDYKKAVRVFEKILSERPDYAEARLHYAYALESLKKYPEMEAQIRRILQAQPQNAPALNLLAYSLAEREVRLDEAHALVTRALAVSPQDVSFQDTLGWIYIKQGKLAQAEQIFSSFSGAVFSRYPEIAYHTAVLRLKQIIDGDLTAKYYLGNGYEFNPLKEAIYRAEATGRTELANNLKDENFLKRAASDDLLTPSEEEAVSEAINYVRNTAVSMFKNNTRIPWELQEMIPSQYHQKWFNHFLNGENDKAYSILLDMSEVEMLEMLKMLGIH